MRKTTEGERERERERERENFVMLVFQSFNIEKFL
jgi:hypothetical protein